MKLIQITFKEAEQIDLENVVIKFDNDLTLNYYRPIKTLYIVRRWFNDDDYCENEFDTFKAAKEFVLKKYKDFEILKYKDVSFRYWQEQKVYKDGELMEEYTQ